MLTASSTSLRKSLYCLSTSSSFNTFASLLQCLSVGCACTMLCKLRAARARTGLAGLGLAGWAGSRWRSWTRSGMQREPRIMSQLAGLEDIASRVRDILSMSEHPRRAISEFAASVRASPLLVLPPPLQSSTPLRSSPTLGGKVQQIFPLLINTRIYL